MVVSLRSRLPRGFSLLGPAVALVLLASAAFAAAASARGAYVSNYGSANVSLIDTATNSPVGSPLGAGTDPLGIAYTPDGQFAYVANQSSSNMTLINAATNAVVGSPIPTDSDPNEVAVTPDGRFAYVATRSGKLDVIDTSTNTVVSSPTVGSALWGVAVTPDGRFAYVTDSAAGAVEVIDTSTNSVVGSPITVGTEPEGITITPDGSFVYVANSESGSVSVISTATNTVVATISLGSTDPTMLAVTPNGNFVYSANQAFDSVSVIATATNTVVGSPITVPTNDFDLAITPDGKFVYVTAAASGSVTRIDTSSNTVVGTPIAVGTSPFEIAISPDQAPIAAFSATAGPSGQASSFNGSASTASQGQTVARYDWSFGDGTSAVNAGPTPTHVYSAAGTYSVTLTVTDDAGCSASLVSTGQTIFCNGGPTATKTEQISIPLAAPTTRVTTSRFHDQQITLTTPSACTSNTSKLAVTLNSKKIAKSRAAKLKFSSAAFYIDKGVRHTRHKSKLTSTGKTKKVVVITYTANATKHRVPVTVTLKLTGLKHGTHTLKVVLSYRETVRKHGHKKTVTVRKTVKVKFTVC